MLLQYLWFQVCSHQQRQWWLYQLLLLLLMGRRMVLSLHRELGRKHSLKENAYFQFCHNLLSLLLPFPYLIVTFGDLIQLVLDPSTSPLEVSLIPVGLPVLVAPVLDCPVGLPLTAPEVVPRDSPVVPDKHNNSACNICFLL